MLYSVNWADIVFKTLPRHQLSATLDGRHVDRMFILQDTCYHSLSLSQVIFRLSLPGVSGPTLKGEHRAAFFFNDFKGVYKGS